MQKKTFDRNNMMLGSKGILTPIIPDFSALRAPEILKTFEIRSFFYEKWLLSHVLAGPKVILFHASMKRMTF